MAYFIPFMSRVPFISFMCRALLLRTISEDTKKVQKRSLMTRMCFEDTSRGYNDDGIHIYLCPSFCVLLFHPQNEYKSNFQLRFYFHLNGYYFFSFGSCLNFCSRFVFHSA